MVIGEAKKIKDPGLWQNIKPDGLAESNQACQSVATSPGSATHRITHSYSHQTKGEPVLTCPDILKSSLFSSGHGRIIPHTDSSAKIPQISLSFEK